MRPVQLRKEYLPETQRASTSGDIQPPPAKIAKTSQARAPSNTSTSSQLSTPLSTQPVATPATTVSFSSFQSTSINNPADSFATESDPSRVEEGNPTILPHASTAATSTTIPSTVSTLAETIPPLPSSSTMTSIASKLQTRFKSRRDHLASFLASSTGQPTSTKATTTSAPTTDAPLVSTPDDSSISQFVNDAILTPSTESMTTPFIDLVNNSPPSLEDNFQDQGPSFTHEDFFGSFQPLDESTDIPVSNINTSQDNINQPFRDFADAPSLSPPPNPFFFEPNSFQEALTGDTFSASLTEAKNLVVRFAHLCAASSSVLIPQVPNPNLEYSVKLPTKLIESELYIEKLQSVSHYWKRRAREMKADVAQYQESSAAANQAKLEVLTLKGQKMTLNQTIADLTTEVAKLKDEKASTKKSYSLSLEELASERLKNTKLVGDIDDLQKFESTLKAQAVAVQINHQAKVQSLEATIKSLTAEKASDEEKFKQKLAEIEEIAAKEIDESATLFDELLLKSLRVGSFLKSQLDQLRDLAADTRAPLDVTDTEVENLVALYAIEVARLNSASEAEKTVDGTTSA